VPTPADRSVTRRAGRPRAGGRDTRAAILESARALFADLGFERTTMRAVAARADVDVALIYHHFDSKESILEAALDEALDEIGRVVDSAGADGTLSAYDRLRSAVESSVQVLVDHLPAVTLLLRVRGNSPLEQRALERRRRIDERLSGLVRDAVEEGSLRSTLDPELTSRLVFGMVNSIVEWFHADGAIDGATLGARVADVVFDGLSVRAAGPGARARGRRAPGRG